MNHDLYAVYLYFLLEILNNSYIIRVFRNLIEYKFIKIHRIWFNQNWEMVLRLRKSRSQILRNIFEGVMNLQY